jgi:hypothetical protein
MKPVDHVQVAHDSFSRAQHSRCKEQAALSGVLLVPLTSAVLKANQEVGKRRIQDGLDQKVGRLHAALGDGVRPGGVEACGSGTKGLSGHRTSFPCALLTFSGLQMHHRGGVCSLRYGVRSDAPAARSRYMTGRSIAMTLWMVALQTQEARSHWMLYDGKLSESSVLYTNAQKNADEAGHGPCLLSSWPDVAE